ncbi:response regulator [Nisaea sp.]|uniref:response regulator n=1 Tax=Nisaea sp. TaxID=2024842 RepID=UPI0032EAFC81
MSSILVVDDDKSLRDLLSAVLRDRGYEVEIAKEGDEALKILAHTRFDIVISDIIMPGKEGIETIREIRDVYPDIQVIAMSTGGSLGNVQILEYARMIGAHEAVRKPIKLPDLIAVVEQMLS